MSNIFEETAKLREIEKRSIFNLSHDRQTTFDTGQITPTLHLDILPGDKFNITTTQLVRLTTPVKATMDRLIVNTYTFFVPNRLVWDEWKEFMGENTKSAWYDERAIPQRIPALGLSRVNEGTLLDHLEIPTETDLTADISALPTRAYVLIYNEWFRNQNTIDPVANYRDSISRNASNTETALGGELLKASKFKDYFTTALPSPQKGNEVLLPLNGTADVQAGATGINIGSPYLQKTGGLKFGTQNRQPITSDITITQGTGDNDLQAQTDDGQGGRQPVSIDTITGDQIIATRIDGLEVDLSKATGATINELRLGFAKQELAELHARTGTRYTEMILAEYGVQSNDDRLDRPELIGMEQQTLNMDDVVQQSDTQTTPQGNVAGYSKTLLMNNKIEYAAKEHGMILQVMVIRHPQKYHQGIPLKMSKLTREEIYTPILDGIGEQPIYQQEIYAGISMDENQKIFGYKPAWAEYKYETDKVVGNMRPQNGKLGEIYNYANQFGNAPVLGKQFTEQQKENVGRTLAVANAPQYIVDINQNITAERSMSVHSIPKGLA